MTTLAALAVFAALFAIFACIPQTARCDHNCGGCAKECPPEEWKHEGH